jgi:aminoglycoside phosphotransferase (APT) family kinase protein
MSMTSLIQETVAQAVGIAPLDVRVTLRAARTYQSNRLYDAHVGGRHFIVKEFLKPDEFEEAPVREFNGLQLMAPLDVAPQPLAWRPHRSGTRPFVVYEYMQGEMWDRRRPGAAELSQLAAMWLRINGVTTDRLWISRGYETPLAAQMESFAGIYRRYRDWAEAAFPRGAHAAAMCLSVLQERAPVVSELAEETPPLCFCRADARFANVIARPDGRVGLVDWEDCGLRDPALDLADIMTAPNQEDLLAWEDWQPFVQAYLSGHAELDSTLERRMQLYLALFPLAWLGCLLSAGVTRAEESQLGGWTIHDLPANKRLRRYLARAYTWPNPDIHTELEALADVQFFPEG